MAIRDLFSKRSAKAAGTGVPEVYQYEKLPQAFKIQVVHIWQRAIGNFTPPSFGMYAQPKDSLWHTVEMQIAEEHGLFALGNEHHAMERCVSYFIKQEDVGRALDVIEATFGAIDSSVRNAHHIVQELQHPDAAIDDLNYRFREHGIGYQFASGQLVRVDSQYVHAEVVKPALALLAQKGFEGPEQEFLSAHRHYREGKHKEAINDALKSFESTLKAICDARGWTYDMNKDTANKLIEIVIEKGLLPEFLQNGLGGLRASLEALVPTTRNRTSGHGQGSQPREVSDNLASYMLHVTASTMVLLVTAHNRLGKRP